MCHVAQFGRATDVYRWLQFLPVRLRRFVAYAARSSGLTVERHSVDGGFHSLPIPQRLRLRIIDAPWIRATADTGEVVAYCLERRLSRASRDAMYLARKAIVLQRAYFLLNTNLKSYVHYVTSKVT